MANYRNRYTGKVINDSELEQMRSIYGSGRANDYEKIPGSENSGDLDTAVKAAAERIAAAESGPAVPEYMKLVNPDGTLKSELQLKGPQSYIPELDQRLSGIQLNKEGLEAIRKRALSNEQSDWEKMMLGKQQVEEGAAMDKSAQEAAANASASLSQLAMKGGYSSGARERIASGSAKDMSLARQGVLRQGMLDRFTIGTKAEDQKLDLLKGLPGMEYQAVQPEFAKLDAWKSATEAEKARELEVAKTNQAQGLERSRIEDLGKYKNYEELMKKYAAEKTGQAQSQSGGK